MEWGGAPRRGIAQHTAFGLGLRDSLEHLRASVTVQSTPPDSPSASVAPRSSFFHRANSPRALFPLFPLSAHTYAAVAMAGTLAKRPSSSGEGAVTRRRSSGAQGPQDGRTRVYAQACRDATGAGHPGALHLPAAAPTALLRLLPPPPASLRLPQPLIRALPLCLQRHLVDAARAPATFTRRILQPSSSRRCACLGAAFLRVCSSVRALLAGCRVHSLVAAQGCRAAHAWACPGHTRAGLRLPKPGPARLPVAQRRRRGHQRSHATQPPLASPRSLLGAAASGDCLGNRLHRLRVHPGGCWAG